MESEAGTTHPIGWPLLGVGAILWVPPLLRLEQPAFLEQLREVDGAILAVGFVFLLTLLGVFAEQVWVILERPLLKSSRTLKPTLDGDAWGKAWVARWRFERADVEFRRYEGNVSLARTYLGHVALAGTLWAACLIAAGRPIAAGGAVAIALLLCLLLRRMWERNTGKIFLLVRVAARWTDEGRLYQD